MLPVISIKFKFIKSTHYDAQLTVETTLKSIKGFGFGLLTSFITNEMN